MIYPPKHWLWDKRKEQHKRFAYVWSFIAYLPRNTLKHIPGWKYKQIGIEFGEWGLPIGQKMEGGKVIYFGKQYHRTHFWGRV